MLLILFIIVNIQSILCDGIDKFNIVGMGQEDPRLIESK